MGRPSQCHTCCPEGGGDPPPPPIGDCENVICVAFIDENQAPDDIYRGRDRMQERMSKFIEAYPNRLLFILDVRNNNNTVYYSNSFINHDKAFSLKLEYNKPAGPAGLIEFIERDNGNTSIANTNNPWQRIKNIKSHYPAIETIFDAASEVSIFTDDSGSMRVSNVSETLQKLEDDIVADGFTIVNSTYNGSEDIICPFAQEQCCTGNASAELFDLCGVNQDCSPTSLIFSRNPDDGLIREYCSIPYPTGSEYYDVCNTCVNSVEEDQTQVTEYTAVALNNQGQNLTYIEIDYDLQASDNGSDWVTLQNLSNGFSGVEQELNVLIDNWPDPSGSNCHGWIASEQGWEQLGLDINGEAAEDNSGYSVSLSGSGTVLAIGAPNNSGNGLYSGHTRVYAWNGSSWQQRGSDIDGAAAGDQSGWSVSLNTDGTVLAIGSPYSNGTNGSVRVYAWNGSAWIQRGTDLSGAGYFGWSVSINGDGTVVAGGAPFKQSGGNEVGGVYVYSWNGSSWSPRYSIYDNFTGSNVNDLYGWSVSLSSDANHLIIGCPGIDTYGTNAGATLYQEWNSADYTVYGTLPFFYGETAGDNFGYSVSLSDDAEILAAGGPYNDNNGSNAGHCRLRDISFGSSYGPDDIQGESISDLSGWSVSINGDGTVLAIGAPQNDGNGSNAGHVRVYNIYSWYATQIGADIDGELSGDRSGHSISISDDGTVLAIGAPYNDGNGSNAGHVRVFNLTNSSSGPCNTYTDYTIGSCTKRVWDRRFRIKATTLGYGVNNKTAYSNQFRLYEWFK